MPSIIIQNIPESLVSILSNAFPASEVKYSEPSSVGGLERGFFRLKEQKDSHMFVRFRYINLNDKIGLYNKAQINAIEKAAVFIQPSIEEIYNTIFSDEAQEIFLHEHVLYPSSTVQSGHWHQDYYTENRPSSVTAIFYYQETNSQATLCFKKHNDNDNNILYSIDTTAKPIVVTFNNLALNHAVQGVVKRDSSMPAWRCLFAILYMCPCFFNDNRNIEKLQTTKDFSIDDRRQRNLAPTRIDSAINNNNVDEATSINQLTPKKFGLFEATETSVNSTSKKRMPTEENKDESANEEIKKVRCG